VSKKEPDQERFERIAAAYLAESEVEGLTIIRYDIVSLLVTGSEKALLRHHKNILNDGRQSLKRLPRTFVLGAGRYVTVYGSNNFLQHASSCFIHR
jgi:hypothetical protein